MENSLHMGKHTPQHRTASRLPKNRLSQPIVVPKGRVALLGSVHLPAPPLPRLDGTGIATAPNVARRRPTPKTSPRTTTVTVRNAAASSPIRTSPKQLATGTRRASLGALNGSARKWTSSMSSAPSSLRRMEATPVAATRVMADGVGV